MSRRLVSLLLAGVILSAQVPALGEPSASDLAIARKLFDDGRVLMKAGKYEEACPKLEEGLKLNPGPGMKFNLAECYEHLGKTASAWALYLDVAAASKASKAYEKEKAARARAAKLEPNLAHVTINVPEKARLPGLVVTRNDETIGAGQYDVMIVLDPGSYKISATAPGKVPWSKTVLVEGSATLLVAVPVLPDIPKPVPPPPPSDPFPVLPIVVAGVGVVAVGFGTYFGLRAKALNDDSKAHCDGNVCDPTGFEARSDARTSGNLSTVTFAIGVAALAASAVLYLTRSRPEARTAVHLAPAIDRTGAGVFLGGAF